MEHQNPDQESVNKNLVSNTHTMNYKLVFNIKKKNTGFSLFIILLTQEQDIS